MYSPNYHLIKVDASKRNQTASGIFYQREGEEHALYHQDAIVEYPIPESGLQKGDKILFFHNALNNRTHINGETLFCARPVEVLAIEKEGEWTSQNNILAEKIYEDDYFGERKEKEGYFKVTYSEIDGISEEDEIQISKDSDYPIYYPEEIIIVRPNTVIRNVTTGKFFNDYKAIKKLSLDDWEQVEGIYVNNSHLNTSIGELDGIVYKYKENPDRELENDFFAVKQDDLLIALDV